MPSIFKYVHLKKNTIYIQMDIITICNQHCWYCYARPESNPKAKWGKIMSEDLAKKLLDGMKSIPYKIILSVLGGEPTLHPSLQKILDYAYKIKNIIKIEVFTNGKRNLCLKNNPKLFMNFSFHPSQTDGKNILKNIETLKKERINFAITCLFEKPSTNFENFIEKIKHNNLLENTNIGIVDSHIKSRSLNVKIPDNDFFKKTNEKIFSFNDNLYTLNEIREKKINDFFGWKCFKTCLKISVDGKINIIGGNNEPLTFEEFSHYKIRKDICSEHFCNDDNNLLFNMKIK